MSPSESFLRNCFVKPRDGDDGPLFYDSEETGVLAMLDGYAIVPKEDYEALLSSRSSPTNPPEPSGAT